MGYFLKRTNKDHQGIIIPGGPTSDRPQFPITSSIRYNSDTNSPEYFDGTSYVSMAPGCAKLNYDKFTGDGLTATFTMSYEHNNWQDILVFIDGLAQLGPGHYDVDGFDITFTEVIPNNLRIAVVHLVDTGCPEPINTGPLI